MSSMTFNGISTVDKGAVIQSPPVYEFPAKDYEVLHIEGKSGDILIDKGSYQNTKRTYYLAVVFGAGTSFVSNAAAVVAWLTSASGYARLEDTYEPLYYRKAMFRGAGELPNLYDQASVIQAVFECKPQRYLKTGDTPVSITALDQYILIENPTNFIALPEITMDGVGLTVNFYSGESYLSPTNVSSFVASFTGEAVIDSELQECYKSSGYVNSQVAMTNGFPKLYPGKNWIKITGTTLTKFSIKPKWWVL